MILLQQIQNVTKTTALPPSAFASVQRTETTAATEQLGRVHRQQLHNQTRRFASECPDLRCLTPWAKSSSRSYHVQVCAMVNWKRKATIRLSVAVSTPVMYFKNDWNFDPYFGNFSSVPPIQTIGTATKAFPLFPMSNFIAFFSLFHGFLTYDIKQALFLTLFVPQKLYFKLISLTRVIRAVFRT
jgi:hypothetical protein